MIYLNNAATGYPKPEAVLRAHSEALKAPPQGQFRAPGALDGDLLPTVRARIARLLGASHAERVFFSGGATDSLNMILAALGAFPGRIVTTATEHNSVLRPLYNQASLKGREICVVDCDARGVVPPEAAREALLPGACALVVCHAGNVTGAVQDMARLGEAAREAGALFVVDAAQSAGCLPVEAEAWGADAVAFAGHKGLQGVQGTGGCYLRPGLSLRPLRFGGTGRDSEKMRYDAEPYEYEPGTQNLPGVAALAAGAQAALAQGVDAVARHGLSLVETACRGLAKIPGVRLFTHPRGDVWAPLVSFAVEGFSCDDVAFILLQGYGIVVRAGLQCAPLIHARIGSGRDGVVRASFSPATAREDVERLLEAVGEIAAGREGGAHARSAPD